jgi:prolyl 4-hydroxylase
MYNETIKLVHIPKFITKQECKILIKMTRNKFISSYVMQDNEITLDEQIRTSTSCSLAEYNNKLIKKIKTNIATLLNKSPKCIEPLQIVKYDVGQFFNAHNDNFTIDYVKQINNQRQYTILIYLNDDFIGGHTEFPNLNLSFKPRTGDALFWQNCSDMYNMDNNFHSLHCGQSINEGTKYAMNIWINFNEC